MSLADKLETLRQAENLRTQLMEPIYRLLDDMRENVVFEGTRPHGGRSDRTAKRLQVGVVITRESPRRVMIIELNVEESEKYGASTSFPARALFNCWVVETGTGWTGTHTEKRFEQTAVTADAVETWTTELILHYGKLEPLQPQASTSRRRSEHAQAAARDAEAAARPAGRGFRPIVIAPRQPDDQGVQEPAAQEPTHETPAVEPALDPWS